MPYDAFGNEIDDDPLAGLGGAGTRPGVPGGGPPRRRGAGAALMIFALLVVVGIGAGVAFLLLGSDADEPSRSAAAPATAPETAAAPDPEPQAAPDPEPEEPEPEQPAAPPKTPTGLQRGSLLRPANLEVALRRLRAEAKGKPRTVRIEAERVDAQVILADGRLRNAQARWDGEVRVLSTTPTPIGGLQGFAWGRIDASAPRRLVRSATGRARKPASAFNYAVLLDAAGLRWSAFLKDGAAFSASPSGKIERQISG